ncbi:MAG: prolyl oligopeptidase family serine peptidase [Chthoniobacter sp.]|nr:prolyl oligopeptidase family serine peptidase [Chthoniobacter sp.]
MRATSLVVACATLILSVACKPVPGDAQSAPPERIVSLAEARQGFTTHLIRHDRTGEAAPAPPDFFRLVQYPSTAGALPAYVGVAPPDGKKHPAIIWIVGGFSNSISDIAWTPGPVDNDQSATAFREAGIVMMYPCLRGGNDDPGFKEGFYGEVDDVLAAADYLSKLDYVDPQRIYLGGHSTGGTLALLTAESTDRFRAIFSFGPVEDVAGYGPKLLPFDTRDHKETALRAPGRFLKSIRTPTFVFEGTNGRSNIESLRSMAQMPHSPAVHFHPIPGADHFGTLHPMTRLIAAKILADESPKVDIQFTPAELAIPAKR